ncbi:GerAB/ArcD/ProY family transporter [Paenibacillus soyae]|uniref:Endospore germination permease n=1 Tax=Paenibacillus soyae TaxID=2969249 RepID=A0A9X2MUB6_9BACL|nr:endospore germination permease [Paenibacillus soyae]MCR2806979.1 endospore germination permease [Paenibacillus soyae]
MIEKGKISLVQLNILVMLFSLGSAILIVPSALSSVARQDGWISAVIGVALGAGIVQMLVILDRQHPGQSLVESCETILGSFAGKLVGMLYFMFFFLLASLVLRNIGDFITTIVMPETPIQAIHVLFLVIIVMGVRLGLEVIGRASEIFLPWIVVLILVLVFFIIPQIDIDRVQPVFEMGMNKIMYGSLSILGIPYFELVVFLMILPYVNKRQKAGKAFLAGSLLGGFVLILITCLSITVLGWDFTARHAFPSYTLAKKIRIGEFLQRIEVMMAVIWFLTIFFKLTLCFYASALAIAQVFKLSSYRPLVLPLGMIMLVMSLVVYPNIVYFREFSSHTWTPFAFVFGFAFPFMLLLLSKAKKAVGK